MCIPTCICLVLAFRRSVLVRTANTWCSYVIIYNGVKLDEERCQTQVVAEDVAQVPQKKKKKKTITDRNRYSNFCYAADCEKAYTKRNIRRILVHASFT